MGCQAYLSELWGAFDCRGVVVADPNLQGVEASIQRLTHTESLIK
jgi:hypothetical protein